ncbi:MAG: hypothetical protein CM15mP74_35730 [Halieaceae bacterium]|nr:MAG: hypothetical protein CM15mP74_35730 [Halieaceae bacterium]
MHLRGRGHPADATRKTIARRLTEAKQTIPHFYLTLSMNWTACLHIAPRSTSPAMSKSQSTI